MDFNSSTSTVKASSQDPSFQAGYYDMIVFSPVRWNFKYQRPQHMVSRLAKKRQVLFVELPIEAPAKTSDCAHLFVVNDHLTVLQPYCKTLEKFTDQLPSFVLNTIVPIGLFYSPVFSPFIECFTFDKVVYDCTHEYGKAIQDTFEWKEKEMQLINEADLILANEELIYDAKYQHHTDVHCLPDLHEHYNENNIPTAILDRTADRMEMLIRSCRNYGVLI